MLRSKEIFLNKKLQKRVSMPVPELKVNLRKRLATKYSKPESKIVDEYWLDDRGRDLMDDLYIQLSMPVFVGRKRYELLQLNFKPRDYLLSINGKLDPTRQLSSKVYYASNKLLLKLHSKSPNKESGKYRFRNKHFFPQNQTKTSYFSFIY